MKTEDQIRDELIHESILEERDQLVIPREPFDGTLPKRMYRPTCKSFSSGWKAALQWVIEFGEEKK